MTVVVGSMCDTPSDARAGMSELDLLSAERRAALREAFARLPAKCQRLLALLIEDGPMPYADISAKLGIPVGSIGPNRGRCLDKLRRDPAIAALINAGVAGAEPPARGLTSAASTDSVWAENTERRATSATS